MAGTGCLKIVAIADYGGMFASSPACATLRAAGHTVTSYEQPISNTEMLVQQLDGCDGAVLTQQRTHISRDVLEQLPNLKWVLNTGHKFKHLDEAAFQERGVRIVGGGGGESHSPGEMAWTLILASQRNLVVEANSLQSGGWQSMGAGICLYGKTLGVYGLGGIGSVVAAVGHAFGMKVIACGRENTVKEAEAKGYQAVSKEELFAQSDVLTLHLQANPATTGIVTAADLAQMKPDALFVNTSRAALVEPGALMSALKAGRPGRAALDVYEEEPLPNGHPLLGMPNVLCSPHLGYATQEALGSYYDETVRNFLSKLEAQQ